MSLARLRAHLRTSTGHPVGAGPAPATGGALPALTVMPVSDARIDEPPMAGGWHQRWARSVVIEGAVTATADWDVALDTLLDKVRRALTRFDQPMETQAVQFYPPADNGQVAWFSMSATWRYTVTYEE